MYMRSVWSLISVELWFILKKIKKCSGDWAIQECVHLLCRDAVYRWLKNANTINHHFHLYVLTQENAGIDDLLQQDAATRNSRRNILGKKKKRKSKKYIKGEARKQKIELFWTLFPVRNSAAYKYKFRKLNNGAEMCASEVRWIFPEHLIRE